MPIYVASSLRSKDHRLKNACINQPNPAKPSHSFIFVISPFSFFAFGFACLDNRLQLPSIAQRILNDQLAEGLLLLGTGLLRRRRLSRGEDDVAVLKDPAAGAGELNHLALGLEEEERLGRGDGKRGVGALGGGGDFGADLEGENLFCVKNG